MGLGTLLLLAQLVFALPPTAKYYMSCSAGTCVFRDRSTDVDGWITSRRWGFGDGAASYVRNPTHFFKDATVWYNVALTVTDNSGHQAVTTRVVRPYKFAVVIQPAHTTARKGEVRRFCAIYVFENGQTALAKGQEQYAVCVSLLAVYRASR